MVTDLGSSEEDNRQAAVTESVAGVLVTHMSNITSKRLIKRLGYNRTSLRKLIENSPLFSLDKEAERKAYEIERKRMVEYLYSYLILSSRYNVNDQDYEYGKYGSEIWKTSIRCINRFDPSRGRSFLGYFMKTWKWEYLRAYGISKTQDELHGIAITKEMGIAYRRYKKILGSIDPNCPIEERNSVLYERMGLPVEQIKEIEMLIGLSICTETTNEGDEDDRTDIISQIPGNDGAEQQYESEEGIRQLLRRVDALYNSELQDRQKPLISDLVTIRILKQFPELDTDGYSFVSHEVIDHWKENKILPDQREIAEKYRRKESSISRTVSEFLEKVKDSNMKWAGEVNRISRQ